ncbi:hypothetical protein HZA75_03500 [Candidatus Roizmanbacteria bacterium]|nr:hypothetical protein [Candidatus Roizmanbacteria bacterium]
MKKIFLLALVIRLISLYLFRNVTNYDLQSYVQIGELTLRGINIYPNIANLHHPYLPFFLYVEALAVWLSQSQIIIIKIINVIFDLGILYLVYLLSKKNLKTAFLYAINPVTILITTLHGQFDVIPIFFLLLSVYFLNKRQDLFSILSFSFAVLTKTWPILFFIPIVRGIKSRRLIILIIFFPVLFVSIYAYLFKSSLVNIGKTLIYYQGLWGIWGVWGLLGRLGVFWQKLTTLIFLVSFFTYSYFNNTKNLIKNVLNLLFFFFIFTTNFSIQYFTWIIPFLILIKPRNYLFLIILISFYLLSFYYFWLFCLNCKTTPYWLIISQNIIGFILWLSFIQVGYLSRKIS